MFWLAHGFNMCMGVRYLGFYWGRWVQPRSSEKLYGDVGAEHPHNHRDRGEITPGKLRRGGTWYPIGVDISTTCHKEYRRRIYGSVEDNSGKLFASNFLLKVKNSLTHCRTSKHDAGQEIRPGPPESSDVREQEVPKFATCKNRVYSSRGGGSHIFQRQSPSGDQGRKLGRTENPGWIQQRQTKVTSRIPWFHRI